MDIVKIVTITQKWSGGCHTGGLAGEDIPLSANIVAPADCYDAKRFIAAICFFLLVIIICCPAYAMETDEKAIATVSEGIVSKGIVSKGIVSEGTVSEGIVSEGTVSELATDSEIQQREYTEDDWDKWRVEYRRIDDRPYEESDTEKKIYSYTQLPTHDTGRTKWAGDWYALEEGGKLFANFGCGICCISNIYSTFVQRPVDPGQIFQVAKEYTSYDPSGKYGAIDWPQMKLLCDKLGMVAQTKKKPQDYAQFQNDVKNADATVVLVCKDNDPGLWFYTNGHYVTLWEYDPADDTVYVTDSSGLFNRERVFLRDVYDALKTRSTCQYMCVDADIIGAFTPSIH